MDVNVTAGDDTPVRESGVPRWLHVLALGQMGVLAALVLWLVLSYLTAGPEENLAGVALVLAAALALPLVASVLTWLAGWALRRRKPGAALVLVAISVGIGTLTLLFIASWMLTLLMA